MRSPRSLLAGVVAAGILMSVAGPLSAQPTAVPKDRECVLDCRHAHSRCVHAAHSNARLCLQSCERLVAKAREVCAAAPDSEECITARREAAACVRSCKETLRTDLRQCMADAKDCVLLCPDVEPPVPSDLLCLRECRRQVSACLERAHAAARDCAEPCDHLVGKARRICAEAPRSEECNLARREASACLQPCREQLASNTRQCIANGQACAASCPPAIDSSTRPSR